MLMMKSRYLIFVLFSFPSFAQQGEAVLELTNDEIVTRFVKNGAWRYPFTWPERQIYIDSAIKLKPNFAYLYEQKSLPYFRLGKYEVAIEILDKAVALDI